MNLYSGMGEEIQSLVEIFFLVCFVHTGLRALLRTGQDHSIAQGRIGIPGGDPQDVAHPV
jgi:hypothetical protein